MAQVERRGPGFAPPELGQGWAGHPVIGDVGALLRRGMADDVDLIQHIGFVRY